MKILPKKTVYWAVAGGIAALCIVIFVGVLTLSPQRKAIKAIESRIKEVEQALADPKANGYSSDIQTLKQKLSLAQKNLHRYVVSSKRASDLTVDVGKIAKQAGVQDFHSKNWKQQSYGPINECQHIREGRMQIRFKSSFSQFAEFISLLERNQPVIFIDYFKIERSTNNDNRHAVDMVLTFFCGQASLADVMDAEISINHNLAAVTGPVRN